MRSWSRACVVLVWLSSMGLPVGAQTLVQWYRQGVTQDPSVRAAMAVQQQAAARMDITLSGTKPQISLSLDRRENRLNVPSAETDYFSTNQTLDIRQPLFRGDLAVRLEQDEWAVREAAWSLEQARRDYAVRLAGALLNDVLLRAQLDLARSTQAQAGQLLHAAQAAFQAGVGVVTDVDEARARLDLANADLAQIEVQSAHAWRLLQSLVAGPMQALRLNPQAQGDALFVLDQTPSALLAEAEPMQAQLSMLRARQQAAQLELSRIARAALPTVDAVAVWQRSRSENVFNPQGRYRNQQVGVQLNWPLYQGGRSSAEQALAQAKVEALQAQIDGARLELLQKLESHAQTLVNAPKRLQALRQVSASAQAALTSSQRARQAGSRTLADVARATVRVQQAKRDELDGQLRALMAYVQLAALTAPDLEAALDALSAWLVPAPATEATISAGG